MQSSNFSHAPDKASGPLMCLVNFNNPHDFSNAILEAADNAGCQFLFEVPAELFGHEDSRAAAVKLNASCEDDQLAFILCNTHTGIINVLSNDEAPARVIRFVESYANVLSLLQTNSLTSH